MLQMKSVLDFHMKGLVAQIGNKESRAAALDQVRKVSQVPVT